MVKRAEIISASQSVRPAFRAVRRSAIHGEWPRRASLSGRPPSVTQEGHLDGVVDLDSSESDSGPSGPLAAMSPHRPTVADFDGNFRGRPTLSLAYAEALTGRFLKAPEGRYAHCNGLVSLVAVDYLLRVRGVRPDVARVEDVWCFLFEELARFGWVSAAEIPSALGELRALWRFLARVGSKPQRGALHGFLSRSSTAYALAERLRACADETVDMLPF